MTSSELIDKQIAELTDWRGPTMRKLRKIINESDPDIVEEWKWGTAVWTHNGLICGLGAFKNHIKINFFDGAALKDPHALFIKTDAKKMRGIDFREGSEINEPALKELIREAVINNNK